MLRLANSITIKILQVSPFGALQNLQNLSNIIVFQNYETFNNLAHGEFVAWVENQGLNRSEAYKMMRIASDIQDVGTKALYLIATLPEEEILSYFYKKAYNANSKSV